MQEQFHFSAYQSVSRARRAIFALLMAVILIAGGMQHLNVQAQAAGLPDFTTIVEKSEPAVVNIRTTAKVAARSGPQPQVRCERSDGRKDLARPEAHIPLYASKPAK